ncbi:HAMP domain-containing histidine kinase [Colwellia psychrerythraea]|nr:HAMP domain-containing histidine kinase [Colwellia psychrerythraea]
MKKGKRYCLGLAIVIRIVEWHHGNITIDNSVSLTGAQFSVTLPKS